MRLLMILASMSVAHAQLSFEVASIRKADPGGSMRGACHGIDSRYTAPEAATAPPLGRCEVREARLNHMMAIAYHLRSMNQIQGGPEWVQVGGDRFSIEAKAEDPTKVTEAQLYEMLQNLIIERFSVKFHRETKEESGYSLVIAKNGPHLRASASDTEEFAFGPVGKPRNGPNMMTARALTVAKLADLLSTFYKPIVDETGLTGSYDFKLNWDEDAGPTLATALQEQLGLKLEPQKVPVTYIIIDSAQKPSEN